LGGGGAFEKSVAFRDALRGVADASDDGATSI
jgi:hypothetical protein